MNDELRKRLDDFRKRQASTANANASIEAERARRKVTAAKAAATRAATITAKAKAAREAAAAAAAAAGGPGPASTSAAPPGTTRESLRTARRAAGVPLAKQLKDALDALMASRAPMPAPALAAACGHDTSPGSALAAALKASAKAKTHVPPPGAPAPASYSYVPAHAAKDKAGLVAAVLAYPDGLRESDLADAYPDARADTVALVASGELWSLPDPDGGATLFAREVPPLINPDADVAGAWHADAQAPADPGAFDAALKRAGIPPAPRRLPARLWAGMAAARRRRGGGGAGAAPRAPRVTTNLHMPELFAAGGPTSIDG